jgi:hypothetical protein
VRSSECAPLSRSRSQVRAALELLLLRRLSYRKSAEQGAYVVRRHRGDHNLLALAPFFYREGKKKSRKVGEKSEGKNHNFSNQNRRQRRHYIPSPPRSLLLSHSLVNSNKHSQTMPRSRKAAAGGGGGGTGKTKAGGASKPKKRNRAVAGVGVDFSRVKRKVGRTLAPAANATDTSISAKSITLPSQSVAENRRGKATTADRDLTLRELLAQLSHYSAKVRRDALVGIAELATLAPAEVRRHSGGIAGRSSSSIGIKGGHGNGGTGAPPSSTVSPLEALAERAADPDPGVRRALRGALAAVAAAVGPPGVAPFLPLLMAHARRAMGSPDPRTRADALSLAAEAVAAATARGKAAGGAPSGGCPLSLLVGPALAACSAQLNPAARASSLRAGSLKSLQASLEGVRAFLEAASEHGGGGEEEEGEGEEEREGDDDNDDGEDEDGFSAAAALENALRRPLYSFRCTWAPALAAVAPAAEGSDGDDGGGESYEEGRSAAGLGGPTDPETLLLPAGVASLLAALCSAWGDLCPKGLLFQGGGGGGGAASAGARNNRATAAADEDDDVERSLAACDLLACARLLLDSCFSSSSSPSVAEAAIRAASPLGRAVGSGLPAPPPSGKGTARKDALDAAAALNVEAARFLGRLLVASPPSSSAAPPSRSDGGFGEAGSLLPPWTARLLGWCDAALATGDALPRSDGGGGGGEDDGGSESKSGKKKKPSPPALLRPLPDAALAAVVAASERGLAAVGARERSAAHAGSLSALALRSPAGSRGRGVAVRAISRALLPPRGGAGSAAVSEEAAASWVPLLPRVVWEEAAAAAASERGGGTKGRGGATAAAALAALHAAARRCTPDWNRGGDRFINGDSGSSSSSSPLAAALKAVAPSLAPLVLVMPLPASTPAATAAGRKALAAAAVVTVAPGALSRLPRRCALLFADALEHFPCLIPAPLLRALVAAAASPSSPYPQEFGERALAAASRAVASAAAAAAAASGGGNDDDKNENEKIENETGISPDDARAWASALLFLLSGAGERVRVVESPSSRKGSGLGEGEEKRKKEGEASDASCSSSLVMWRRHARAVAAATRALRASSGGGVDDAAGLLSDGLLEAAGVKGKEKRRGGASGEGEEGREGRAAAGALAALSAVPVAPPSSSPSPSSRLLDSVPPLVAAYARGGGCAPALSSAGMGPELALRVLRRRVARGGQGAGAADGGALAETLGLLLAPPPPCSSPSAPLSITSSCALISAIAGDPSLRSCLLGEGAAAAARRAVSRARAAAAAAAKARGEEEAGGFSSSVSAAAAAADAALAAALGS